MVQFNSDDPYIYYYGQKSLRRNGVALTVNQSPKCSTWMQSQNRKNDLCLFPRQAIQYHNNPSLCPNDWCWRSWSLMILWRPTRPSRTNTQKSCPFHHRGLECKSGKSRDTWSNRQIWPWSTKWSRAKANRVFPRECTGHTDTLFQQNKRRLYTWTSQDGQYQNQIDYILCSQRWRSSIVSKNKTGSWLQLMSWTL